MKKVGAYLLLGVAFVTCPCHLILTLPLALGLLGGTALGAALAAHTGAVVLAMGVLFSVALLGGSHLLVGVLDETRGGRGPAPSSGRRARNRRGGDRTRSGARGIGTRKRSRP